MNYCQIYRADIANGKGVRVSLFVCGCSHHCKGCFNPKAWEEDYGECFNTNTEELILKELNKPYIKGLSILGGEPLESSHIEPLLTLVKRVRTLCRDKDIWLYTGYTFEELLQREDNTMELVKMCDVLVDGKFEIDKKDLSLAFRGSSNQRIIDIKKSIDSNEVIVFDV